MFRYLLPAALLCQCSLTHAQESHLRRGLFYSPAISREHIVFVRGDDLWRVSRDGGVATPLGISANSNSQPRFSPDGREIALLSNFEGAYELGTVPITGGTTHRVTYYPRNGKGLQEWLPSGRLLYFTESDFRIVESQLYTVDAKGGLPQKLPIPYGADASLNADGETLAYTLHLRPNLYWKRYKGGMAQDIWLYNLRTGKSEQVTKWEGYDLKPMWVGKTLYYLSDNGPEQTMNVWSYDPATRQHKQVTHLKDFDAQGPSACAATNEIIFQRAGDIWVVDLNTGAVRQVDIQIPVSAQKLETRKVDTTDWTVANWLSPDASRLAVEARGDLWLVDTANGNKANLTKSDHVFERDPAWSPDGKRLAYFTDRSGEYQLTVAGAATGVQKQLTSFKVGFRQTPRWSPNGSQIAFTDNAGKSYVCSVSDGVVKEIDQDPLGQIYNLTWSPDSRWIVYPRMGLNTLTSIWAYDTVAGTKHQLTSGMVADTNPVFDSSGNYLFYFSVRDLGRRVNQVFERASVYVTPTVVMAVPLRNGVGSPMAAAAAAPQNAISIETEGFEGRGIQLPIPSGRFTSLAAAPNGRIYYLRNDPLQPSAFQFLDLKKGGKQETVLENVADFQLSADGKKAFVNTLGKNYIVATEAGQKPEKEIAVSGLDAQIDPTKEWGQVARDVWRLCRDYFYDEKMHGLDWPAQWQRVQPMLQLAATRDDVNYALGEMVAELSVGHMMMTNPGDTGPGKPWRAAGQLGADFALEDGAFRITKIYRGAAWDSQGKGPLSQPGVDAKVGEYLLAVNGNALDPNIDPWSPFLGTGGKDTKITLGPNPKIDSSSREVEVIPLERETDLRLKDWVERNRSYVDKASGGRLGYLYLPDQGNAGNAEFAKQFYSQAGKEGLVVDVRWTTGGSTSDRMIETLNRPLLNAYTERYSSAVWPIPEVRIPGPKCLLVNRVTSSSGENFAFYFRKSGLGKVIGTRTWGGLIGVNGNQALIDNGFWWIPQSAFFVSEREWMPEGVGVKPDIEVMDDPALMRNGADPQLDAAVKHLLDELRLHPEKRAMAPPIKR